jgi:ATP-dependent RNA helicase DeaD
LETTERTIDQLDETLDETDGGADESGFAPFPISNSLRRALRAAGYQQPTPVQAGVIPQALAGDNVIGQARTGTGKTAAFMIPIIERLQGNTYHAPQAVVLVPTRELAEQVEGEFTKLAAGSRLKSAVLVGGKPMRRQLSQLQRQPEVVVGTPGRVIDHLRRGTLKLDQVQIAVLDEADRMLDIGFRPDIEKILRRCPKERQTLLLSATVSGEVLKLAERYMTDPVHMNFSPSRVSVESVTQKYFTVNDAQKLKLLIHVLKRDQPAQAIIFCRTKRGADKVHRQLKKIFNDEIGVMHGDLQQSERTRVLQQLRDQQLRFLVATDVVGRGIDVSGISHIINFDIPHTSDDYVHRVGRTGRMGRDGTAYTFVTPEEGDQLTGIEMLINVLLERDHWDEGSVDAKPNSDGEAKAARQTRPVGGLLSRSGRSPKKYRRSL